MGIEMDLSIAHLGYMSHPNWFSSDHSALHNDRITVEEAERFAESREFSEFIGLWAIKHRGDPDASPSRMRGFKNGGVPYDRCHFPKRSKPCPSCESRDTIGNGSKKYICNQCFHVFTIERTKRCQHSR